MASCGQHACGVTPHVRRRPFGRLAGAKKQMDEPEEVRKLEADLAAAQEEIAKLQAS